MAGLSRREAQSARAVEPSGWLDRMFDDWTRMFPLRRALLSEEGAEQLIRVDEYRENGSLVVRAELPGIDPDKDVELSVSDGHLHIRAERREEEETEGKGWLRHELRYGSLTRTLPLPEGVSEDDITATYKDGILEVRIPAPETGPARRIAIEKS